MEMRRLGKTNKQVSVIGLGGGALSGEGGGYGFGHITESTCIELIERSIEIGINLFDTAPIYGFGTSEIRLGKALKKYRDQAIIVSKGGVTWDQNKRVDINNSPVVIQTMLEESLKRLNVDYIDIYMIHWPDPRHDIRKSMEVLVKAKEQGKILFLGLSNTNEDEFLKAQEIANISVLQDELNVFETQKFEKLRPLIKKYDLGFMSWGTLDKGILAGTVTPERTFDKWDARSWAPWWKKSPKEEKWKKMAEINKITNNDPLSYALKHNLSYKEVSCCLCGYKNTQQLIKTVNSVS